MSHERRTKRWRITARDMLELFVDWRTARGVELPLLASAPEGYRVLGMCPIYASDAIDIVVEHESFDVVEDGCECPLVERIGVMWECIELDQAPEEWIAERRANEEKIATLSTAVDALACRLRRYQFLLGSANDGVGPADVGDDYIIPREAVENAGLVDELEALFGPSHEGPASEVKFTPGQAEGDEKDQHIATLCATVRRVVEKMARIEHMIRQGRLADEFELRIPWEAVESADLIEHVVKLLGLPDTPVAGSVEVPE